MTGAQFQKLIKELEIMREKPAMYVGESFNPEKVLMFLYGVRLSLQSLGLDTSQYREIVHNDGWKFMPVGLIHEMQNANISNYDIVKKLIDLEIELYKQSYEKHPF